MRHALLATLLLVPTHFLSVLLYIVLIVNSLVVVFLIISSLLDRR